jgi:hypothetical protein
MDLKGLKTMLEATALPREGAVRPSNIAEVNRAIAKENGKEVLVAKKGVLYFSGGDTDWWEDTVASVQNIADLTLGQWLDEWREKRDR